MTDTRPMLTAEAFESLMKRLRFPGRVEKIGHDMRQLCQDAGDALRAERVRADRAEADRLVNFELHLGSIKRWHETCDAVLDAVTEHGTLAAVVEVVAEWLDGSDALDDEVCDRIRRAQAKAATVDSAPAAPRSEMAREMIEDVTAEHAATWRCQGVTSSPDGSQRCVRTHGHPGVCEPADPPKADTEPKRSDGVSGFLTQWEKGEAQTDPPAPQGRWRLDDDDEPWFDRPNDSRVYRLRDVDDYDTDPGSLDAHDALVDLVRHVDTAPDIDVFGRLKDAQAYTSRVGVAKGPDPAALDPKKVTWLTNPTIQLVLDAYQAAVRAIRDGGQ